jgi:hypothetical protein
MRAKFEGCERKKPAHEQEDAANDPDQKQGQSEDLMCGR